MSNFPHGLQDIDLRILSVAEDQIAGFHERPFDEIARRCELPTHLVIDRLLKMQTEGVVRRVRQTLLSTSLADGALVAWRLPTELLQPAYNWLIENDPFSGHIVLREADSPSSPGADYRLWTTLKVPSSYGSTANHCVILSRCIGAEDFQILPVVGMFTLSVGHIRRANLQPGAKTNILPTMQQPAQPQLSSTEWDVLLSLKESLGTDEFSPQPWTKRAARLGMSEEEFCAIAKHLDQKRVIGRFATFFDHMRASHRSTGTGSSGLFHWSVPRGMEQQAGKECGRHLCMTHCYWRSGGERFGNAQIMGVAHASTREDVRAHKAAIDAHLADCGIPVLHTAVFWSKQAEIRPSEIRPDLYQAWLNRWS